MTATTLTLDLYNSDQSLHGSLIDSAHTPKLRAVIRRNAYDMQSWQRIEAWTSETGWAVIRNLPIEHSRVAAWSYVTRDGLWEKDMTADLHDLLQWGHNFYQDGAS